MIISESVDRYELIKLYIEEKEYRIKNKITKIQTDSFICIF